MSFQPTFMVKDGRYMAVIREFNAQGVLQDEKLLGFSSTNRAYVHRLVTKERVRLSASK